MNGAPNPKNSRRARRRGPLALGADFVLALQERLLWPLSDALRTLLELPVRGLRALAYGFRRALVWPVADRFALLSGPGRALSVTAATLVIAVGVTGILATGANHSDSPAAETVAVTPPPAPEAGAQPAPEEPEPTLHGATPVFTPPPKSPSTVGKAERVESPSAAGAGAGSSSAATAKISSSPTASRPAAAETAIIPGPTVGAKAIAVAREFSGAFVVYETKGGSSDVRKAFSSTATPELTKALMKRPPRQPAGTKVPKARVLNIVPGPSRGGVYTVSVSLLRVGVTSELRLEMEKLKAQGWRVTNVLG